MPALSLKDYLLIAVVPSIVPAAVLVLALGIATWLGELDPYRKNLAEQLAGGALLITYIKELFPNLMEQSEAAVESLLDGRTERRSVVSCKLFVTSIVIACFAVSVFVQAGCDGFPGVSDDSELDDDRPKFTPGATVAYFIGFYVDGVCLAYDDEPVAFNRKLIKKLILSAVFSIDNLLDGFGLAPVLREAFGPMWWSAVMLAFSGCVLLGAVVTAYLRYYIESPVAHVAYFSASTTAILYGALELTDRGLTLWVAAGMALVWFVLFVGDLFGDDDDDDDDDEDDRAHRLMK